MDNLGMLNFQTRQSQPEFWCASTLRCSVCAGFWPSPTLRESLGQDFVLVRAEGNRLVFTVCDGVSQSFLGDLAAQFLGIRLAEFLWCDRPRTTSKGAAVAEMGRFLESLLPDAARMVDDAERSLKVQGILRETLSSLKSYGTETVFAAGLVDLGRNELEVWQLGNVALLTGSSRRPILLGDTPDDGNRWSSTQGVRGQLAFYQERLPERLLAYTDGATLIAKELWEGPADRSEFQDLATGAQEKTDDDLAFFLLNSIG
jgi:hypothetical protein